MLLTPDESRNRLLEGKDLAAFLNLATLYGGILGRPHHLDPPMGIQTPACMFYFPDLEQTRTRLFHALALDAEESTSHEVQLPRLRPGTQPSWFWQGCCLSEQSTLPLTVVP